MTRTIVIDSTRSLSGIAPGAPDALGAKPIAARFLADGDSWFSIGYGPVNNMLMHFDFPIPTSTVNLAAPGRTLQDVIDEGLSGRFGLFTGIPLGSAWTAILLSLSGHDLIAQEGGFLVQPNSPSAAPQDYVSPAGLAAFLAKVTENFVTLFQWIDRPDSSCRGAPVFAHTYDFIVPRDSPVRLFPHGPVIAPAEVKPVYDAHGVPAGVQSALVRYLLGQLANALNSLATSPSGQFNGSPRFFVIPTQGTLTPADPGNRFDSDDWENEDHPTPDGYDKLGRLYVEKVSATLGL